MRKFMALLLVSLMAVTLVSPVLTGAETGRVGEKISVVSTLFAPYDFVRQVAGDSVEITMLLPPASESHSYEPTPQDIIRIQHCDVFIHVGGETDAWVDRVLESMDKSPMQIISLMDCVNPVEEEIVEGMEAEAEHDPTYGEEAAAVAYDEHVWTSPRNAKLIVKKIIDTLCAVDSGNAAKYQESGAAYLARLDELDGAFQDVVEGAARKTLVFGDRFPFRYLADAYGLDYFAAFPGCSTETEASAATVAFLINKVEAEKIPVVFHAELGNQKMAGVICEATGAKMLLLHACHNVTKAEFEGGATYLGLMQHNVEALKEALY